MKAVILAGGRGKRMRPVTDYVPKPLVSICNVPIMEWQIRHLRKFGISDVVMCTGYKTGMIEDRLRAKDYGINVKVSAEESPLGTGGAIKQASCHLAADDSFVVLNGDVITDIDINRLVRVRNSSAAIPLRTNYGILDICHTGSDADAADTIKEFGEKTRVPDTWMNAGVYHLGREVLDELPETGDIERTLFPDYAKRGILKAVRFGGSRKDDNQDGVMWQSIDSFKDLESCAQMLGN